MPSGIDERQAIQHIIDQLRARYEAVHSGDHVARTVRSIHQSFRDQPIREFVPLLVERQARETLTAEDRDHDRAPTDHR